ncbi:MAG: leader peptidase (prepilin peptidase)/N-methyltransferase [Acidipropionibacterium sp.]|nr:leader peptidase (prepilin peptidase)/N-methyltransferase [Acidipropionibacterium sp.]
MHAALGSAVALGLALTHLLILVPRLPEPDPEEVGGEVVAAKPRYRDLVTPPRVAAVAILAIAAGAACTLVPAHGRALWWVWAGSVLTLVAVDQATTFLPLRLWRWSLAEGIAAAVIGVLVTGSAIIEPLIWAGLGLVASVPFWLVWRLRAGIGFGDVRLAAGTGSVAAVLGVDPWLVALMASALAGAVLGVASWLVRRIRPSPWGSAFGYGPALWLGPWAALALA